jgi:hypothetical protein
MTSSTGSLSARLEQRRSPQPRLDPSVYSDSFLDILITHPEVNASPVTGSQPGRDQLICGTPGHPVAIRRARREPGETARQGPQRPVAGSPYR